MASSTLKIDTAALVEYRVVMGAQIQEMGMGGIPDSVAANWTSGSSYTGLNQQFSALITEIESTWKGGKASKAYVKALREKYLVQVQALLQVYQVFAEVVDYAVNEFKETDSKLSPIICDNDSMVSNRSTIKCTSTAIDEIINSINIASNEIADAVSILKKVKNNDDWDCPEKSDIENAVADRIKDLNSLRERCAAFAANISTARSNLGTTEDNVIAKFQEIYEPLAIVASTGYNDSTITSGNVSQKAQEKAKSDLWNKVTTVITNLKNSLSKLNIVSYKG